MGNIFHSPEKKHERKRTKYVWIAPCVRDGNCECVCLYGEQSYSTDKQ